MSVGEGTTVKIMISMPSAVHSRLEALANNLGSSKSKIVQQAIILMESQLKEVNHALDKDISV